MLVTLFDYNAWANERIRGASQGFIAFILWGIGSFVGTMLAGKVLGMYTVTSATGVVTHHWQSIWMTPALGALPWTRERSKPSVSRRSRCGLSICRPS